jgi:hypothetical protein
MIIDLEDIRQKLQNMSVKEGNRLLADIQSNPNLKLSQRMRLGDIEDEWKKLKGKPIVKTKNTFLEQIEAWLYVKSINLQDLEQFYLGTVHADIDEHNKMLKQNLPKAPGWYIISGYNNSSTFEPLVPIYIGISERSIKGRLNKDHHIVSNIHKRWGIDFHYTNLVVNYLIAEPSHNIRLIEAAFISLWKPVLNGTNEFPSRETMEITIKELADLFDFHNIPRG